MIERRKAIVGLAAIFAAAMGARAKAQSDWKLNSAATQTPQWFMLMLDEGGGLKFQYKGETVSITADELWTALKS
jgi:hypothetical protein